MSKIPYGDPITADEIAKFRQRIVPVPHGQGLCWIYRTKSKSGKGHLDCNGNPIPWHYALMRFRGTQIGTHRFALALKEGCCIWELFDYQAGHLPNEVCMGAPCCNPEHMVKQPLIRNIHQRDKERRRYAKKFDLVAKMYPKGLPIRTNEQQ